MRTAIKGLVVGVLSIAAAVGVFVARSSGSSADWPCKDQMHVAGDSAGDGYKDEETARNAAVELLANVAPGFSVSPEESAAALSSDSGSDRYDASTGNLYINNVLVAQFIVNKQDDGTYVFGTVTTCAPADEVTG